MSPTTHLIRDLASLYLPYAYSRGRVHAQTSIERQSRQDHSCRHNLYIRNLNSLTLKPQADRTGITVDAGTRQIARQRIHILFILAERTIHENPNLAERYVETARKIAMSAKIRLPTECRRQVCKHCKSFILPGVNCRVRLQHRREPHMVITCLKCGGRTRIPITRKENRKHE